MGNSCWVRAFYTEPEARGEKKKEKREKLTSPHKDARLTI